MVLKTKYHFSSHPLGTMVTYALHLWLVGKPMVAHIRHDGTFFRYLLRVRRYKRKSVEVGVFRRGWLNANFIRKGASSINLFCVRKLEWLLFRVVSKYPQCVIWFCHKARVWQTDGQRITTPKTALAYRRAVKTETIFSWTKKHYDSRFQCWISTIFLGDS